jgi:ketosteroid isomerase-like protein
MSDEVEIQKLLDERARTLSDKNAEAAVGYYSSDVVNFDLAPPLAYRGREATDPTELQGWFDTWDGPIGLAFDQLEIRIADNLAFAFGFLHMTGRRTDGSDTDVWARITVGLERRSGSWKIVHEHQSFPTRMDGSGKSASDLRP